MDDISIAEIHRALLGPWVPYAIKGLPPVRLCDVRQGRSPHIVTVLAVRIEEGEVAWAKRIVMSPIDEKVIALKSAEQRN